MKNKAFWSVLCLLLGVFLIAPFTVFPHGNYHQNSSIDEVNQLIKDKKSFVVYLARNDCPSCQKADKKLLKRDGKLQKDVYRVEILSEKNTKALNKFMQKNHTKVVPSFYQVGKENQTKALSNEEF